jgi:CRP-like cAMP-binding protein
VGRFLGAADVISGSSYGITATAYTNVTVNSFTADQVNDLLGNDKDFSLCLAKSLSQHSRALGRQLIGESFFPAIGRVGFALQNLAVQIGIPCKNGSNKIELPITHNELASYVGCNRVTVTRALAALASAGLIEKGKKSLLINNYDRLSSWLSKLSRI